MPKLSRQLQYAEVPLDHATSNDGSVMSVSYTPLIIIGLKCISLTRDIMDIGSPIFLRMSGWNEVDIRRICFLRLFASGIAMLSAGDYVDRYIHKRELAGVAYVVTSVTCAALPFLRFSWEIAAVLMVLGLALAVVESALNALTLGVTGSYHLSEQISANEMSGRGGTVLFLVASCVLVHYSGLSAVFLVGAVIPIFAIAFTFIIPPHAIMNGRARGLTQQETESVDLEVDGSAHCDPYASPRRPSSYREALHEHDVSVLLAVALTVQVCRGAMQQLGLQVLMDTDASADVQSGATFIVTCAVVGQVAAASAAYWAGWAVRHNCVKWALLWTLSLVPLRGVLSAFLLSLHSSRVSPMLLLSQMLDGLTIGAFSVLSMLIIERATRGSGRLNFVLGALGSVSVLGELLGRSLYLAPMDLGAVELSFVLLGMLAWVAVGLEAFCTQSRPKSLAALSAEFDLQFGAHMECPPVAMSSSTIQDAVPTQAVPVGRDFAAHIRSGSEELLLQAVEWMLKEKDTDAPIGTPTNALMWNSMDSSNNSEGLPFRSVAATMKTVVS